MKCIGIIPARYKSTRFEGKPLANICGRPMVWWVYQQCLKVSEFNEVYVATDSQIIKDACDQYDMKVIMTKDNHQTHVNRIHEVSDKVNADYYVVDCGDEPLINPDTIRAILPRESHDDFYVGGLCRYFSDPAEVIDPANIKVVTNNNEECILLSRSPVPFPYKTIMFKYKKVIGVECYNKKALDFFVNTEKGFLEKIEDITLQRFLENKIHIKYRLVDSISLSVDTPRDLEKVVELMEEKKAGNC